MQDPVPDHAISPSGKETHPSNDTRVWSTKKPDSGKPEGFFDMVQKVLNPPVINEAGSILVQRDGRSIVYKPQFLHNSKPYPLILISFNPALHLPSLPRLRRNYNESCSLQDTTPPSAGDTTCRLSEEGLESCARWSVPSYRHLDIKITPWGVHL